MKAIIILLTFLFSFQLYAKTKTLPEVKGKLYNYTRFNHDEIKLEVRLHCKQGLWANSCPPHSYGSGVAKINPDGTFVIPKIKYKAKRTAILHVFYKTCHLTTPSGTVSGFCSESINRRKYRKEFNEVTVFDIGEYNVNFELSNGLKLEEFLATNKEYYEFYYNLKFEDEENNIVEIFKHELEGLTSSDQSLKVTPIVYTKRMEQDALFKFTMQVGLSSSNVDPVLLKRVVETRLDQGRLPKELSEGILDIENFKAGLDGEWDVNFPYSSDALSDEFNVDRFAFRFRTPSLDSTMKLACIDGELSGTFYDRESPSKGSVLVGEYELSGTCNREKAQAIIKDYIFKSYKTDQTQTFKRDLKLDIYYVDKFQFKTDIYSIDSGRLLYKETRASKN